MSFFFDNKPYIAIIGDMKMSRKMEERKEVQVRLSDVLLRINETYKQDIVSKFTITLGDEFQGLLANGINVLRIIKELEREMFPVQFRFGIGIGAITTDINYEMSIGADGPGYYFARKAIDHLKNNEQKSKTPASNIRIEADQKESEIWDLMNVIFSLINVIETEWSDRQREFIYEMEGNGGSQSECAARLNVTQSSLQRGLINANYYAYKNAIRKISNILKEIRHDNV